MLEFNELLQLMKVAAKASTSAPTSYSFNGQNLSGEAINEAHTYQEPQLHHHTYKS